VSITNAKERLSVEMKAEQNSLVILAEHDVKAHRHESGMSSSSVSHSSVLSVLFGCCGDCVRAVQKSPEQAFEVCFDNCQRSALCQLCLTIVLKKCWP
jgi:hypothetical protein